MDINYKDVCDTLWTLSPFDLYSFDDKITPPKYYRNGEEISQESYGLQTVDFLTRLPNSSAETGSPQHIALNKRKAIVWLGTAALASIYYNPKQSIVLISLGALLFKLGHIWDKKNNQFQQEFEKRHADNQINNQSQQFFEEIVDPMKQETAQEELDRQPENSHNTVPENSHNTVVDQQY